MCRLGDLRPEQVLISPEFQVTRRELAAWYLSRMRPVAPGGGDPRALALWAALSSSCSAELAVDRAVAALGRAPELAGCTLEVAALVRVRSLAPVVVGAPLVAVARVRGCSPVPRGVELGLAVELRARGVVPVVAFDLELRVSPRSPEKAHDARHTAAA